MMLESLLKDNAIQKVDTVKRSLQLLTSKLDSLEKIVSTTEISKGFFTEIISLQLSIFVVIIGLGGWISWTQIFKRLTLDHENILKETNQIFQHQRERFDIEIAEIRNKLLRTSANVAGSLYNQYSTTTDEYAFLWAISTASSTSEYNLNPTPIIDWLNLALSHLNKLNNTHLKSADNIAPRLEEHFNILNRMDNEAISSLVMTIRKRSLSIIYTVV